MTRNIHSICGNPDCEFCGKGGLLETLGRRAIPPGLIRLVANSSDNLPDSFKKLINDLPDPVLSMLMDMDIESGPPVLAGSPNFRSGLGFGQTVSKMTTCAAIDVETGKAQYRKFGQQPKFIPVADLSSEAEAAVSKYVELGKRINAQEEKLADNEKKIAELQELIEHEPDHIQQMIFDELPDFMGEEDLEICFVNGAYVLKQSGEIKENVTVTESFGAEIVRRKEKLGDLETAISSLEEENEKIREFLEVKEPYLKTLDKEAFRVLRKKHPDIAASIQAIQPDGKGGWEIIILESVDESSDQLPEDLKKKFAVKLQGENLPPALMDILGIAPALTEKTESGPEDKQG